MTGWYRRLWITEKGSRSVWIRNAAEGKMSCGRGYEKKQHIEDLKRQAE